MKKKEHAKVVYKKKTRSLNMCSGAPMVISKNNYF